MVNGLVEDTVVIKNRIHNLLDKYDLRCDVSDLFGKRGLEWLRNLQLPAIDKAILNSDLQLLDALDQQILSMNIRSPNSPAMKKT